jgi:cytochrome P450
VTSRAVTKAIAFDPFDPAFRVDPDPFYRALREHSPVARLPDLGCWAVTGYDEVRSFVRDPRAVPKEPPAPRPKPQTQEPFLRAREEATWLFTRWMHRREPADHLRLRRLTRHAFTPDRVAERRARIQELTDDCIESALESGRVDVVKDLGRPVAITIAAELLGIPEAMRGAFGTGAGELAYHLELGVSRPQLERSIFAMASLASLVREIMPDGRDRPAGDDLLSALERARARGELTEEEAVVHAVFFFFGGHVTAQHLIGNGVLALARHPDQWELLRAQPSLIQPAIEELVRYDPPAPVLQRIALADIELGGETIRSGDKVMLLLAAANRDPAVFDDPDRLDITRSPNPHLGFGQDAHYCLGAALARLEAEVAIGTLVRHFPPPRLETETLQWEDSFVIRGLTSLPILLG